MSKQFGAGLEYLKSFLDSFFLQFCLKLQKLHTSPSQNLWNFKFEILYFFYPR